MKKIFPLAFLGLVLGVSSCKHDDSIYDGVNKTGDYTDTDGPLKVASDFPIGIAIDYSPFKNNEKYRSIVAQEADNVTFGYEMKHGAIVRDNGTLDFSRADELVNLATAAGLEVFGHTLGWHQNQNASYLKNFAGIVVAAPTELALNGGFEAGGGSLANWSTYNASNGATVTVGAGTNEVRSGTRSMKAVNPVANPGNQWRVQVASDLFATGVSKQYSIKYWVKAASAGGSIRLSTGTSGGGSAQYQGDQTIGTTWQQVTWTITANSPQTRVLFDMGLAANTYFIDDVSITEVVAAPSSAQVAGKLDVALQNFISNSVTRYKGKVKAWDVVNELFADNGSIRDNNNTVTTPADVLVWSNYMKMDYVTKAFNYAHAADPDALLFINDYGLESSEAKLNALVDTVNKLKAAGIPIHGIGTQMHANWNSSRAAIDNMFKKLASTGLKVRVSELDIKLNPALDKPGFSPNPTMLAYQAAMYHYVVESYIKNVPAAQRHGLTIWGVDDASSWLATDGKLEFPLLWDKDFNKKPAYSGVLQALKGK